MRTRFHSAEGPIGSCNEKAKTVALFIRSTRSKLVQTHTHTHTITYVCLAIYCLKLTLHISRQLPKVSQFDFLSPMKLSHRNNPNKMREGPKLLYTFFCRVVISLSIGKLSIKISVYRITISSVQQYLHSYRQYTKVFITVKYFIILFKYIKNIYYKFSALNRKYRLFLRCNLKVFIVRLMQTQLPFQLDHNTRLNESIQLTWTSS